MAVPPSRPIRLELVGLFPELFNMCVSCCSTDEFGRCGVSLQDDQLRDYPPDLLEVHSQAAELFTELLAEYHGRVAVVVTGLMSPRGVYLALRHRLPTGVSLFLEGERLSVRLQDRPGIRRAVARALARQGSAGAAA